MTGNLIHLDVLTKFQAIHNGHHHVGNYNVRNLFLCQGKSFLSVFSLKDLIFVLEDGT